MVWSVVLFVLTKVLKNEYVINFFNITTGGRKASLNPELGDFLLRRVLSSPHVANESVSKMN